MSLLSDSQRRKAARAHRKMSDRKQNKTRQKLERAMRENGSLGRLVVVQAALRKKETADTILARIKLHEETQGKITSYDMLRTLVELVLTEQGLELDGVMVKFTCGPGCGGCNHVHGAEFPCAFPLCVCRKWSPGRLLGIGAAPTPDAIRVAARQAGVESDIDRPV